MQERARKLIPAFTSILVILLTAESAAWELILDSDDPHEGDDWPRVILPYAFSTELLDTGVGAVYSQQGMWQPQDSLSVTGYVTSNDSWGVAGTLRRSQIGNSRWFFSPFALAQRNRAQRFYSDSGFLVGDEPGGSNDSSQDDFAEGPGWNIYVDTEFRYILPIGTVRDEAVHRFETDSGILTSGSLHGNWSPRNSGRTSLVLKPFALYRTLRITDENVGRFPPFLPIPVGEDAYRRSNGIIAFLEYDNRDFPTNPERGSYQKFTVTKDFGWFGSTSSWSSLELDLRKYFSFGSSDRMRQRVLALAAWTSYSPSWNEQMLGSNGVRINNAPPESMGPTLGGLYRLRGYPTGRFNDKAAVYYGAEYRVVPLWDPLRTWPLLRKLPWRWWQWVGFAEVGRVAPEWDISTLHEDLKWSAGLSLRIMVASGVGRLDIAKSSEGTQFVIMFNQPF